MHVLSVTKTSTNKFTDGAKLNLPKLALSLMSEKAICEKCRLLVNIYEMHQDDSRILGYVPICESCYSTDKQVNPQVHPYALLAEVQLLLVNRLARSGAISKSFGAELRRILHMIPMPEAAFIPGLTTAPPKGAAPPQTASGRWEAAAALSAQAWEQEASLPPLEALPDMEPDAAPLAQAPSDVQVAPLASAPSPTSPTLEALALRDKARQDSMQALALAAEVFASVPPPPPPPEHERALHEALESAFKEVGVEAPPLDPIPCPVEQLALAVQEKEPVSDKEPVSQKEPVNSPLAEPVQDSSQEPIQEPSTEPLPPPDPRAVDLGRTAKVQDDDLSAFG